MSSPTLSLCLIVKNEEKNLPRLLDSIEGCMDEIIVCDTGSTDKTVEIAEARGCKVVHFEWVDSFCKARNFAFSHATKDYIIWLDADDVLGNRDNFIKWKETSMQFADCFLNTYNYAMNGDKPVISFMRERVFKRAINPVWQYDIHEGVILKPEWRTDYAKSWTVNHLRDAEDLKADRSRNIKIIEKIKNEQGLDARLQFYYGKELFESQRQHESLPEFDKAIKSDKIEPHDKLLSFQYACYASQLIGDTIKDELKDEKNKWYKKAIVYAMGGLEQDPTRAELYVACGDCYLKMGEIVKALPFYSAAKHSLTPQTMGAKIASPVYAFKECYGELPSLQMSKIHLHLGRLDEAMVEAQECFEKYKNKDAKAIIDQITSLKPLTVVEGNQKQNEEIVITCPPQQAYPFDEEIYKTKPLGGSETALVQMARLLKEKTGRPVKVFNSREEDLTAGSGVEYISNKKLPEYLSKHKPHTHIAWRHNIKLTTAPTYLWAHDLITPSTDQVHNFDAFLALSTFHKDFTIGQQGIPPEKIKITRNGIDLLKLSMGMRSTLKNENKIVWMSSPDRGLEKAMLVCDEIIKTKPEIELHVYYGIENLYKYGPQMAALADKLKSMMEERSYVKYHGFTEQSKMYAEVSDAVIWLHPCNFIETFCITALEMLALKIYPVTRRLGALANTLAEAESKGMATMLEHDAVTADEIKAYAAATITALDSKAWEDIKIDMTKHDWSAVADEWVDFMKLKDTESSVSSSVATA